MHLCTTDLIHNHFITPQPKTRGLALTKWVWDSPRTLGVAFSGGTIALREYIEVRVKQEWVCGIKFDFTVPWGEAELRAELFGEGGWSFLGSAALLIPQHKPTMRLGWAQSSFDAKRLDEVDALVLHEFGHALALHHEQHHIFNTIQWNIPKVLDHFVTNLGWSEDNVRRTYLNTYPLEESEISPFDRESIMIYPVEDRFTLDGKGVPWNMYVSAGDKKMALQLYPIGSTTIPDPPNTKIYLPIT